jgi:hydroxymethylpyrimidine pyrophosphatase-like HAD family hydrolase
MSTLSPLPSRPSPVPPGPLPRQQALDAERSFYNRYAWCLNPCLTVGEAVTHLRAELGRLEETSADWQQAEVRTNVYLLACAVLNAVEDWLHVGAGLKPQGMALLPGCRLAVRAGRKLASPLRALRRRRLCRWRGEWAAALDEYLWAFVAEGPADRTTLSPCRTRLAAALVPELPAGLRQQTLRIPNAFHSQDLTHLDILTLGQKWVRAHPDRERSVVVVGLRTSGSYLAPLLAAFLRTEGYARVEWVTIRPKDGLAAWEADQLRQCARQGDVALIVDDPPGSGGTLADAVGMVRGTGFDPGRVVALLPVHPACREWKTNLPASSLSRVSVLTLEPAEWHRQQVLNSGLVESRLQDYFERRHYRAVRVTDSAAAGQLNARVQQLNDETRRSHLKRVFEVRLETREGQEEVRYVLAKGVGWGWLGYQAFLAGDQLREFVPPLLGLRDGILYTEWLPQDAPAAGGDEDREPLIRSAASYVAARVRTLGLGKDPSAELTRDGQQKGFRLLYQALSRAYASSMAGALQEERIRRLLTRHACPYPTLLDGKMRRAKWIRGGRAFFKTDFEHHGLGKAELNVVDPAYDLADAILYLGLTESEEAQLVNHYLEQSGDTGVRDRLLLNKLLAGTAARDEALVNLSDPRLSHRHADYHQQYLDAWHFLVVQTTRFCGEYCRRPSAPRWRSPLAVLDIDGVLDRWTFGFPTVTAAGVQALSLLHTHDFAVAVNTARSVGEVKEYCRAYGLAGGVAEYGSYLWDAVAGRGRVQVSPESLDQLAEVREALRRIPGMFLDDTNQYSIRAYVYEQDRTRPLPTLLPRQLLRSLKADRLRVQQNYSDTAIVAQEVDKGTGLLALLDWVGRPDWETVAVGDTEPDLAMFRVARRSFAPAQISCRRLAEQLGCRVSAHACQSGLLDIVRSLVHPDGSRCPHCRSCERPWRGGQSLVLDLLEIADLPRRQARLRGLFDFLSFHLLRR